MSKPQHKILKIKEMKTAAVKRAKANITGTGIMVKEVKASITETGITVNKAGIVLRQTGITLLTAVIQTGTAVIIIQLKLKIRRVTPANEDLNLFSCAI